MEPKLRLSAFHWLAILALDLFIKIIFIGLGNAGILGLWFSVPMAIKLWSVNVVLLMGAYYSITWLALSSRTTIILTSVMASALFLMASLFYLYFHQMEALKHSQITYCVGLGASRRCTWVKGAITAYGIQREAIDTIVLLAMNLIPFLAVSILRLRREKVAR